MTKILNFGLKIKEVVGRVAHAKSSDPTTPPPQKKKKFETCTLLDLFWGMKKEEFGDFFLYEELTKAKPLTCKVNPV